MKSHLIYSPRYNLRLPGFDEMHPFDGEKFGRAWAILEKKYGDDLLPLTTIINQRASDQQLKLVHSEAYVSSLLQKETIAAIVEMPAVELITYKLLNLALLDPLRFATAGTVAAARQAISGAIVFNLGGGFHHAFHDHGEGFCFFADAALAIETLKSDDLLADDDQVVMIDLDAHRGNGFHSYYQYNRHVGIFDLYNGQIYPGPLPPDQGKTPFIVPMPAGTGSKNYLRLLKSRLPVFLDQFQSAKLAFYNAGTDVLDADELGVLNVSASAIEERDRFVVDRLRERGIATVIMTSGGYSGQSFQLVAELASYIVENKAES